ncbi:DUF935 domain-containing protein [Limnohabitans sp.]|uniref:DUF935 domain-containing protein n=1 Tax=Limnohabitans sp. TaxID=1907725 RepID=UPI00286F612E|nr:DUF935 domain-containing protein [Limnohabitans sp.]
MIVDAQGRPIETAKLQDAEQTAELGWLRTRFESHPSRGLNPSRLAGILQRAEQGDLIAQHELFQDMEEKDGHLFAEMQKRRLALQKLDWEIVPPKNASAQEKAQAEYIEEVFENLDFDDLVFDLTDAIGHGYSALELSWERVDGSLIPTKAQHRPQSWLCLPQTPNMNRNELRLRDGTADGAELWPFGWVLHHHRARSGYLARSGLFRVLSWPFLFKNFAVRDLAEFLEIYGLPLRLGTYGPGATKEDKTALLRAVVGIGHDAAAIVPEGMKIDFKEAAKTSGSLPHLEMVALMERTMSKAILGGTLTSGEGSHGTQALGNVHNEVRHDLRDADARQLSETIKRQLIYPILALNKGLSDVRRAPRIVFDTQESEDIKVYADSLPKLVGMGMQVPVDWAHDKLKIPRGRDGEPVLAVARPELAMPPVERPANTGDAATDTKTTDQVAANRANGGAVAAQWDELDTLAADMLGNWEETLDPLIQSVLDAANAAPSLEAFQVALEGALSQLDPKALTDMLARGQFAARVWGKLNQRSPSDLGQ